MSILTISDALTDANLFEAWAKVSANGGCAGIDGESIEDFQQNLVRNLETLRNEVTHATYRPAPLLRVEIDKKSGDGKRPLSIPVVRDRVLQTALAIVLTPLFEAEFEDNSFAYRRGRSVDQAVRRIATLRDEGYCWVVDADIRAFFDEIDRKLLMSEVRKIVSDTDILHLIKLWLDVSIVDGKRRLRPSKGVPQGSPISPMLSNLYLDHLDEAFLGDGMKLIRFADDFLVLCKSQQRAEDALEMTAEILDQLSLELNEAKTQVVDFNQGFRFLGVQFIRSMVFKAKYPLQELNVSSQEKSPKLDIATPQTKQPTHDPELTTDTSNTMAVAFAELGLTADHFPETQTLQAETPEPIEANIEEVEEEIEADLPANHDPRLRTLYLMEHGYVLGKESQRLVVRCNDKEVKSIAAIKVDQIVIRSVN